MVSYCVFAVVNVAGGPSGSGKTSLAHKMANIVGCEVVSLESYYKSEQVKDFKYDDFSSLDLSLLSKVNVSVIFIKLLKLGLNEVVSQSNSLEVRWVKIC